MQDVSLSRCTKGKAGHNKPCMLEDTAAHAPVLPMALICLPVVLNVSLGVTLLHPGLISSMAAVMSTWWLRQAALWLSR